MSSSSFDLTSLGDPSSYNSETPSDYPSQAQSPTVYMPVMRPPTPAPSPHPVSPAPSVISLASSFVEHFEVPPFEAFLNGFQSLSPLSRQDCLATLLSHCSARELFFISKRIAPLLKCDFLADLPVKLALHILGFIDQPRTLARIACVSRKWHALVQDEQVWRRLVNVYHFDSALHGPCEPDTDGDDPLSVMHPHIPHVLTLPRIPQPTPALQSAQSSQTIFKHAWLTCMSPIFPYSLSQSRLMLTLLRSAAVNWKRGGRCLRAHRFPVLESDSGVVTSVALDADWLVAGHADHRIYIFSTHTGSLVRTLVGHELGVWAVDLISHGGALDPSHPPPPPLNTVGSIPEVADGPGIPSLHNCAPAGAQVLDPQGLDHLLPPSMRAALALDARYPPTLPTLTKGNAPGPAEGARSDVAGATHGWGQPSPLVVSGGCDKDVRVWDVRTGCASPCLSLYLILICVTGQH